MPWQLPLANLSHVHYAFAGLSAACRVESLDEWADFGVVHAALGMSHATPASRRGNAGAFRVLKLAHPQLRVTLSVGGWAHSAHFSTCARSAAARNTLVDTAIALLQRSGFDGIDVDWEFPTGGGEALNSRHPDDWANYARLLRELRVALDAAFVGDARKELSVAVGMAGAEAAPMTELAEVVDLFNLMTYDYAGWPWSPRTAHNAPLHYDPASGASGAVGSVAASVQLWLARVNASQLVMGLPAYGRSWAGSSQEYAATTGAGPGTFEAGVLTFADIVANYLPISTRHWNAVSRVPYLVTSTSPPAFISYDDEESIEHKAELARSLGLAGLMFWEASADDKNASFPLLQAAGRGWGR